MSFRTAIVATVSLFLLGSACGSDSPASQPDGGTQGNSDSGSPDAGASDSGTPDAGKPDGGSPDGGAEGVTWYRDVLPIVQENCQGCHAPGGIAPFQLITYADAASRHPTIASAVASRQMPPWMPNDTCIEIKNERRLTQAEIDVIVRWSQEGAAEGDPADAPPDPPPPPGLPRVDASLDPGSDYVPQSGVTDDYRCFMLPPAISAQTDVIGMDVVPGTRTQVHHVILFAVPLAAAQQKDADEAGLGWTCYGGPGVPFTQVKMIGGWVPGSGAAVFPAGTGIRLAAGEVIVMQVHYNLASGTPLADRTQAKLMYASAAQPIQKQAYLIPASTQNFNIPAGGSATATAAFTVPALSATIYGITPHMHQLGRSIRAKNATTGACLIDIPDWDFHWQQPYEYATPVNVSLGQRIEVECIWDNPTASPVTWGEGTADEMCVAFFYVTL